MGNGGAKHHHKVLHDGPQVFAILPAEIVRKHILDFIYEEISNVLKLFIQNVIPDAVTYTEHAKRKTNHIYDGDNALKSQGRTSTQSNKILLYLMLFWSRYNLGDKQGATLKRRGKKEPKSQTNIVTQLNILTHITVKQEKYSQKQSTNTCNS